MLGFEGSEYFVVDFEICLDVLDVVLVFYGVYEFECLFGFVFVEIDGVLWDYCDLVCCDFDVVYCIECFIDGVKVVGWCEELEGVVFC